MSPAKNIKTRTQFLILLGTSNVVSVCEEVNHEEYVCVYVYVCTLVGMVPLSSFCIIKITFYLNKVKKKKR